MAPATKYGGKTVECQPGTMATAKSKLTTVWTETTSGVASPASSKYAFSSRHQCVTEFRQPSASRPKNTRPNSVFARSRMDARSGSNPRYQNKSDTRKYVVTANTSQTSGLRNCGQIALVFGNGKSQ